MAFPHCMCIHNVKAVGKLSAPARGVTATHPRYLLYVDYCKGQQVTKIHGPPYYFLAQIVS
jgi:hypothetical protein